LCPVVLAVGRWAVVPFGILKAFVLFVSKATTGLAIPIPIMNILKYFSDEMKSDIVQEN